MTDRKPKPVTYTTVDTPDGLRIRVSTDPSVREGLFALAVSAWLLYEGLTAIKI